MTDQIWPNNINGIPHQEEIKSLSEMRICSIFCHILIFKFLNNKNEGTGVWNTHTVETHILFPSGQRGSYSEGQKQELGKRPQKWHEQQRWICCILFNKYSLRGFMWQILF